MPHEKQSTADLRISNDIRAIREAAGMTQAAVADIFGWERDAVSKIEAGKVRIRLIDYLAVVKFCRHAIPGHPAIALAEFYIPSRKVRPVVPYVAATDTPA